MEYVNLANKQKGVVLLASMIMIITVTSIAVALMSSSTVDIKMSNAAQNSQTAASLVEAESEKTINLETNASVANNRFLYAKAKFAGLAINVSPDGSESTIMLSELNNGPELLDCPRRIAVTNGIKCNTLKMEADLMYGKDDKHMASLHSGIAQELGVRGKSK